MNIHEYQGKSILKRFGVAIQEGIVAETPEQAVEAAKQLQEQTGTGWWVVKAQVHAGGRGKGGGVKLAKNLDEVKEISSKILGMTLVTPQTGPEGKFVRKVLIAQDVYYPGPEKTEEFYMSVLLDRQTGRNIIIYTTEGGMDIEEVAHDTPEKILREEIDPRVGLQGFQARKIAYNLGLSGEANKQMVKFIGSLYKAYDAIDASQFEINPVLKTSDNKIIAVDAKVNLDENGLFRHPDILEMRDVHEEDATEVEAGEFNLNYVKLDGNIGCMVNGAGLAMATMDIIKLYGAEPANFLDVGGGATKEKVTEAFKIITSDPNVKGILVNIFGGIMRCDIIAEGVIAAVKEVGLKVPLVVRLEGTNVELGKDIIRSSGLNVIAADNLSDAAKKIVTAVKG
jgi:succinyl-CoA synthetase beta subunit